jgi:hypothetical protein
MSEFVEFVLDGVCGMNEADVRRVLGRRAIDGEIIFAVLHAIRLWGGMRLAGSGEVSVECNEFALYLDCLCNKVIDQEACDFLESQMDVEVSPDTRPVKFIVPDELKDNQRIKAAREKAAFLNFEQRLELVAKKSWRDNVKRRREERKAEEEVPAAKRSRWSDDEEFAVEVPPADWEDRVSFSFLFNVYFIDFKITVAVESKAPV